MGLQLMLEEFECRLKRDRTMGGKVVPDDRQGIGESSIEDG